MGSIPSRVDDVRLRFRRQVSVRVRPAPTNTKNVSNHNVTITVDQSQLGNGFVVRNNYSGCNALEMQRKAFAHASNQSLEAMFTTDSQDPNASDVLERSWSLVETTCLPDDECRQLWSSQSWEHMRSNGWITVRLFVCTMGPDFQTEHQFLHDNVFRELQHWCESDQIHLIVTDLYASLDSQRRSPDYVQLCLEEIDRCTEDGVPMLFLGLLSQTVGWVPEKHQIPKSLAKRYGWIHGLSLVEMMCVHGVYRSRSPNALFLFQEDGTLESLPEREQQQQLAEPEGSSRVEFFKQRLQERFPDQVQTLKHSTPVKNATVGGQLSNGAKPVAADGLETCRLHILTFFKERIRKQFPLTEGPQIDVMEQFRAHQDDELARTVTFYQKRSILPQLKTVERQVQLYINQGGPAPLLISSSYPGSGKTGVLSRSVHHLLKNGGHPYKMYDKKSAMFSDSSTTVHSDRSWAVFHHFAGPQPRSTELAVLLQRIWNIAELQPHRLDPMPSDINQLALQVCELLSRPPAKRLTIFINHLDQIQDAGSNYLQKWLPRKLPEDLRLVITCGQREKKNKCWKVLKAQYPSASAVQLEMLKKHECLEMIQGELPPKLCARLGAAKLNDFIDMMEDSTPMAIMEACRQLTQYHDTTSPSMLELEERMESIVHCDLVGMLTDGLVQLEETPGFPKVLVAATMCLLHCSRAGLLESELLKMLGAVCASDTSRLEVSREKFASEGDVTRLSRTAEEPSSFALPLDTAVESPAALPPAHDSNLYTATGEQMPDYEGAFRRQSQLSMSKQSPTTLSEFPSTEENIATGGEDHAQLPGSAITSGRHGDNGHLFAFLESLPTQTQRRQSVPSHSVSALASGNQLSRGQGNLEDPDQDHGNAARRLSDAPVSDTVRNANVPNSARAPGLVRSQQHIDSVSELPTGSSYQPRFQRRTDGGGVASTNTNTSAIRRRHPWMSRSRYDKRSLFQLSPPPPPPDLPSLLWARLIRCLDPWIRRVGDKSEARWALSHNVYHEVVKAYYYSRCPSNQAEFPFHLNSPEFYNAANSHFGKSQQKQVTTLAQRRASQFNLHLAHEREEQVTGSEGEETDDGEKSREVHRVTFAVQHSNHEQLTRQRYGWWHERLAGFFEETDDEDRRAEELPVHLEATCNETQLRRCLSRWPTFMRLFTAHNLGSLLRCWKQAGGVSAATVEYRREMDRLQPKSTTTEMIRQRIKCAQLLCKMEGLKEAQQLLEEALKVAENPAASVPAASFDRDQATIRVCLAEVFDAMVQHTDFQHASLQLANAPGGTHVQPSVGTPGDSHLDTTTTHPLAACIPDDAMTGFSSEFQSSFGRGGGSNHPPAKEDTPVDDEWLLYHCHLKDTIRAASCKISKQVIQEAHLASELILASLPSPLKSSSPRQRRHGSDAGVSSTTSSRKSSILASRDSLLVPGNQQRRASSERWTRGDSFAVVLDKENEKALQLLGRACSLICKHGHLLLATDASSDQHERRKWFALCQHAGLLCVDTYEKVGDVVQQIAALINLATTYASGKLADQPMLDESASSGMENHTANPQVARTRLEEALALIKQHVGHKHALTAQVHHHLALLFECQNERLMAAHHLRLWESTIAHLYGPEHPVTKRIEVQCQKGVQVRKRSNGTR